LRSSGQVSPSNSVTLFHWCDAHLFRSWLHIVEGKHTGLPIALA
jgi:hypothetical protein